MRFHKQRACLRKGCAALLLMLLCVLLPLASLAAEMGTVTGGTLRLRAEPSLAGTVLGAYPTGTWVEVTEQGTAWHRVKVDGKSGYMSARYISLGGLSTATDAQVHGAAGYINLRETPSLDARVLATYPNGTRVKILARTGGFYRVQAGTRNGYMAEHLVRPDSVTVQATAIIRTNNGGNLNLRNSPSMNADVIQSYRPGTQVEVLQRDGDWCRVRIHSVTGFMRTQYLSFGSATPVPPASGTVTGIVQNPKATQVLNLRETPSLDARVLAYYYNGTRVEVLEQGGTWHRVRVDGRTGYMMARYLQLTSGGTAPPSSGSFSATLMNPNGGTVVNFRAQPGLDTTVYGTYRVGTAVTVLAWDANWCMVRIGSQTGYVSTYFLRY